MIKTLHRILNEGLPDDPTPGVFRTIGNAVTYFAGPDFAKLNLAKIKQIGTAHEIEVYQNSLPKLKNGFNKGLTLLNEEELAVFKKIMVICPMPDQIEPLMLQYALKLKELESNATEAIDIGCFAHCEIGKIHPFRDSQGRIGRVLLLSLFRKGGEGELVIPDKGVYGKASLDEMDHPGTFKKYVIETLAWTKAHRNALDLVVNAP
jgi:hypothetical protein